jgi:hypothetical protein
MCDSETRLLAKRLSTYQSCPDSRVQAAISIGCSILVGALTLWGWGVDAGFFLPAIAVVALLIAAGCCFVHHIHLRRRIHLHQHGLVVETATRRREVLWSEIVSIFQIPPLGLRSEEGRRDGWSLRLELVDGTRLYLRSFHGLRSLGCRIQDQMTRRLLVHTQEAFRQGRWIRFGKRVAVGYDGFRVGLKPVHWCEIENIIIDEEDGVRVGLAIDRRRTIHVPVRMIANLHLLSELLEWIRRFHARSFDNSLTPDDSVADDWQREPSWTPDADDSYRANEENGLDESFANGWGTLNPIDSPSIDRPRRPR